MSDRWLIIIPVVLAVIALLAGIFPAVADPSDDVANAQWLHCTSMEEAVELLRRQDYDGVPELKKGAELIAVLRLKIHTECQEV